MNSLLDIKISDGRISDLKINDLNMIGLKISDSRLDKRDQNGV